MILNLEDVKKSLLLIFPIALITGPLIPEVIIFFLILIYFYSNSKRQIITDFQNKIFIFCLIFYAYILLVSLINFTSQKSIINSISFIRFPIFSLIIYKILKSDEIFKQRFLYILLAIFLFFFVDSSIQILLKKNIFGLDLIANRPSSLFGDELILGSYLVKLSPILFALLLVFHHKINKAFYIIIPISIFTILISGERTAFITSLLLSVFLVLFIKFNKKNLFVIFTIFFLFLTFNTKIVQDRYIEDISKKFLKYNNIYFPYEYTGFILSSFEQFKNKPIIGGGVRSFRVNCENTLLDFKLKDTNSEFEKRFKKKYEKHIIDAKCSTHPHNIFLEFASELGSIGLLFLIFKFIYIFKIALKYFFKNRIMYDNKNVSNLLLILSPLLIIFPFLPSGSFFNNWSLSIYFLNIGFFMFAISAFKK